MKTATKAQSTVSTELENRLRELPEADGSVTPAGSSAHLLRMLQEAARIGAEIEREECAKLADHVDETWLGPGEAYEISRAIRARGSE